MLQFLAIDERRRLDQRDDVVHGTAPVNPSRAGVDGGQEIGAARVDLNLAVVLGTQAIAI